MSRAPRAAGAVGLEMVVAMLLTALVLGLGFQSLAQQQRLLTESIRRAELQATFAAIPRILGDETRPGVPGRDWQPSMGDSLALRAFRGTATVCSVTSTGLLVSYSGDRAPDPTKDSVLVLDRDARWAVAALRSVRRSAAACGSGQPQLWLLDRPIPGSTILRVYERGSYSLGGGGLRYRRGGAGRQPLTYPRLDSAVSHMGPAGTGPGIQLELRAQGRAGVAGARLITVQPRSPRP